MCLKKCKKTDEKSTWYFYDIPLTKETFFVAFYIIAIIVAVCISMDAIVIQKNSFLVDCSLVFLVLSAFLYFLTKGQEAADKDYEISQLKKEIKKLESMRESDKHIIKLLEKEIEHYKNET